MSKVILQGYIEVPLSELSLVKEALERHIELTRAEPGCIVFNIEPAQQYANRFNVYEEFVDQAAFEQHQVRVKQPHWGKISQNVARHYQISDLSEVSD
ncbi:putative quinol monooxygenase [Thalassotalea euphylliae]|uniref:Antibiotic biosynthesis monooxygenase n=1 Tax=Thalassotalea euphylliae TaxID=1655234 RepID=A0A3E0UEA1_9GAMM|nr:antibiotic biosynthesis monooxygenase [Thalassotalea euphylliae]REL35024.1 antibiotic biosynthesis monooxygenase [Thalassotalea euphylliae]